MFCNQCGAIIPDNSRFCNNCGANQSTIHTVQTQTISYFDIRHGVLVKYNGREKNVVIPAGVVEIEKDAFPEYVIDSITIPEGCLIVRINTFVKKINFPSRIQSFSLSGSKNYRLDSITIPEGCVSFSIDCYVKTIHLPSTIQSFWLADPIVGSSADDVFFAPGTKVIRGKMYGSPKLHIPSSVTEIDKDFLICLHKGREDDRWSYRGCIYAQDDLNNYTPEIRKQILMGHRRCRYCGGEFMRVILLGEICKSCKRPMDYDYSWGYYGGANRRK